MAMTALTIMPFVGETVVAYNYVRTRYQWEYIDYSNYKSMASAFTLVGKYIST